MSRGRRPGPAATSSRRMELAETALNRVPPCSRIASMKQGPFAPSGFCCPADHHYYDPLRLPLDNPPFPGSAGYRRATLPGPQTRGRGGSLQFPGQPSDHSTPLTPGGSSTTAPGPRSSSVAFAKQAQARLLLDPPQAERGLNDDAAGFTSCCGLVGCTPPEGACHSTSTPPFRATPGVSYRGPWRLPGPDLHRLAVLSLTTGYITCTPSELQ